MNFITQYAGIAKIVAVLALVAGLVAGYFAWEHHIGQREYLRGKAEVQAKWDAATTAANAKLAAANERVRALQAQINAAQTDLANKQQELHDAQLKSASLESDLRSGAKRMSALVTIHNQSGGTGSAASAASASVDQGTEVTADLSAGVAANLERFRINENSAIARLDACIVAYDAVKAASDAIK